MKIPPRARAILDEITAREGLTEDELLSRSSAREFSHPRQEAMARIRALRKLRAGPGFVVYVDQPAFSLPQIGRMFNRDHTTVYYGLKSHQKRMEDARG